MSRYCARYLRTTSQSKWNINIHFGGSPHTNYLFIYHTFHSYPLSAAFPYAFIWEQNKQLRYNVASLCQWNRLILLLRSRSFTTRPKTTKWSCSDICLELVNFVCVNLVQFEYIIFAHTRTHPKMRKVWSNADKMEHHQRQVNCGLKCKNFSSFFSSFCNLSKT